MKKASRDGNVKVIPIKVSSNIIDGLNQILSNRQSSRSAFVRELIKEAIQLQTTNPAA